MVHGRDNGKIGMAHEMLNYCRLNFPFTNILGSIKNRAQKRFRNAFKKLFQDFIFNIFYLLID